MKYSVLMSVYARENPDFLRASLDSVFQQSLPPTQVVLVKDGPLTFQLDQVIENFVSMYSALEIIALPSNNGLGAALNVGIKHCDFERIGRMDSDDIAHLQRFEKQLTLFDRESNLVVVGSWVAEFEHSPTVVRRVRRVPVTHREVEETFGDKCPINHPSVCFLKSEVIRAGGYRSDFAQEDYDLWGRMLAKGCRFQNIPECLVFMRSSDALFARRGGWRYALSEARLQYQFMRLGLVSNIKFLRNVAVRFIVRIMPNRARIIFYSVFLRS